MKSIMISIRPEWVEKIANGIKSIEVRSSAPKDWMDYLSDKTKVEPKPRPAFIYCTKGKPLTRLGTLWNGDRKTDVFSLSYPPNATYNGKVVGKFTLRKVERIITCIVSEWGDDPWEKRPALRLEETDDDGWDWHLLYDSGFDGHYGELYEYLGFPFHGYGRPKDFEEGKTFGYAWHISDLEIFDEPKPLSDFKGGKIFGDKPPQSWKYVEVEE
jgi:predicted transcriptional regulator